MEFLFSRDEFFFLFSFSFFFFNDTATTEIYTLSLHDALPIFCGEIMTMPGLPSKPAAESIHLNEDGQIEGLF